MAETYTFAARRSSTNFPTEPQEEYHYYGQPEKHYDMAAGYESKEAIETCLK